MARLARIVLPGIPHHVTQRGNRRLPIFFSDDDRSTYLQLLSEAAAASGTRCLAWCLMDNHVHLILLPETADGLRAMLGEAHRRYMRMVNFREGWRGYLFQGRFASYPMDDADRMAAVRENARRALVPSEWERRIRDATQGANEVIRAFS